MNIFRNVKELEIQGKEYKLRTDYRDILNIISLYNDKNYTDYEKTQGMIHILFEGEDKPPFCEETVEKALLFLDCDSNGLSIYPKKAEKYKSNKQDMKLYDWNKDFQMIVAAMNKYFGYSIRECEYLHWWDFVAGFMEIGDSSFANIVGIRKRKKLGKMTKEDKEFYYENRDLVEFEEKITKEDIFNAMKF